MHSRLEMQTHLESILGSRNVYFQPPESVKMSYPAIVYSFARPLDKYANDSRYIKHRAYDVQYISKTYSEDFIDSLLGCEYCSYRNYFCKDNLHHHNFTMYY